VTATTLATYGKILDDIAVVHAIVDQAVTQDRLRAEFYGDTEFQYQQEDLDQVESFVIGMHELMGSMLDWRDQDQVALRTNAQLCKVCDDTAPPCDIETAMKKINSLRRKLNKIRKLCMGSQRAFQYRNKVEEGLDQLLIELRDHSDGEITVRDHISQKVMMEILKSQTPNRRLNRILNA
jgi:hypothetical protein